MLPPLTILETILALYLKKKSLSETTKRLTEIKFNEVVKNRAKVATLFRV